MTDCLRADCNPNERILDVSVDVIADKIVTAGI